MYERLRIIPVLLVDIQLIVYKQFARSFTYLVRFSCLLFKYQELSGSVFVEPKTPLYSGKFVKDIAGVWKCR